MPSSLATWDTVLILCSGVFLLAGRYFIARRNVPAHRRAMLAASAFALAFLVLYLVRYALEGTVHFRHGGLLRAAYLAILGTHTVAATALVPLVAVTLYRALRGRFAEHRRIARWTFPAWLYVAATGWLIYYLLYHV